jgi:hypothetical protein
MRCLRPANCAGTGQRHKPEKVLVCELGWVHWALPQYGNRAVVFFGQGRTPQRWDGLLGGIPIKTMPLVHDGSQVVSEYVAPVYQSQDIGSPTIAGSFSDNGAGTVTLAGSGTDVWGTSDQFRFAYRSLTGDGSITALVATQTNTDPWAKAGVMIRGSLDPAAAHAFMAVTPGNGEAFQRRNTAGGASTNTQTGGGTGAAPYWVRLVRAGSTLTGYRSVDGVTWSLVGSDTVTLPTTVSIGYAVCAHTNAALSTVTFTNGSTNEGKCPARGPLRCVHLPSFSVLTRCPPPPVVVKAGGGHLSVHQLARW